MLLPELSDNRGKALCLVVRRDNDEDLHSSDLRMSWPRAGACCVKAVTIGHASA
jgi:hypothetical protein